MASTTYADPAAFVGATATPLSGRGTGAERSLFGDLVLVAFLLAQCFDGVFTYVGVVTYGIAIEANPLISALMATLGEGAALTVAKVLAAALGICLHFRQIHVAVALLAGFYVVVAILPWMVILFS